MCETDNMKVIIFSIHTFYINRHSMIPLAETFSTDILISSEKPQC